MPFRREPEYGNDYYPRTHRPNVAADFDYDRPCGHCGYNQRGLKINEPCPDCGSVRGLNPDDSTLPWDQEMTLWHLVETTLTVLLAPHSFAKLVWSPLRLDFKAAKQFRRISILVSTVILSLVALTITQQTVGPLPALLVLPVNVIGILVWLNSATLAPIAFIRGTGSPVARRAEWIAHYTAAGMMLTPLHLLLLLWTRSLPITSPDQGWIIAAGVHLLLLFAQLTLCSIPTSWMFHELVDCTPQRALGFTLSTAMTGIGAALPMLVGAPALLVVAIRAI